MTSAPAGVVDASPAERSCRNKPKWQNAFTRELREKRRAATWLSYIDPSWLAKRHGLSADVEATVSALTTAIHAVAKAATGSQ
jgi:hypothetical protein